MWNKSGKLEEDTSVVGNPQTREQQSQSMNPVEAWKLNRLLVYDFDKLRNFLTSLDLMEKPQYVYNMDEMVVV